MTAVARAPPHTASAESMHDEVASPSASDPAAAGRRTWADLAFLAAVTVISVLPYVTWLGFYSDDWAFLSLAAFAHDQSLLGAIRAQLTENLAMRPGQAAYFGFLYWAFGLHPLPYHVVNATVLTAGVCLLYLAIRELDQPRLVALALAAVYSTLPHYSADRFWVAAFQATLSITLYLLSLYADLRSLRGRLLPWRALGLAALVGSVLCYEVAVPLFLLNAALAWWVVRRRGAAPAAVRSRVLVPAAVNLAALVALMAYKASTTNRQEYGANFSWYVRDIVQRAVRPQWDWLSDYGFNVRASLQINFGYHGVLLPREVWNSVATRLSVGGALAALAIGVLVYAYLRRRPALAWGRRRALLVVAAGAALHFLGYAIFLTNYNVGFTPTGIGNRTAIAAAFGVAVAYVGAAALAASFAPARLRHRAFCALVAAVCAADSVVLSAVASYWRDAWATQRRILAGLARDLPTLPARATLLLDGECAYLGPGIVFESAWDLAGALRVQYRAPHLRANVVSRLMRVDDDSIRVKHYGVLNPYPYGPETLVYDARRRRVTRLTSAAAAREYFSRANPDLTSGCPWFLPGHGVTVLQ